GVLDTIGTIDAVGHRVVHGAEEYHESVLIDEKVIETIEKLIYLAPLHNKANLAGIKAIRSRYPKIKQVAVFDTSFHQTIPPYAYMYALPYALYEEEKIRRYGFHGTSHRYIATTAASYLNQPLDSLNLITFHLGNGDSVCAVQNGKSIDTSMGFTPLEGLIMGTRCGDLDPEIILYLQRHKGMSIEMIDQMLNKESGLKGICGVSDMRDVIALGKQGNQRAILAIDMFTYHAKKYLGSYMAILKDVDAIVFTGGIGEHSALIREKILANMEPFGILLDREKNLVVQTDPLEISADGSAVKLIVIHTDEEREIARETIKTIEQS
ncbi:MAG TPA: acetate kinase, partial [Sulfuricurvum sp.]|nr:acetate kinase [Sulfuricurvum sp.]